VSHESHGLPVIGSKEAECFHKLPR
jgi:hypothetical protein